jgi:SAM-dependent methyltransferase
VNPRLLPYPGPLQNARKDYLPSTAHLASITGKRVLCIGYSEPEIDEYVAPQRPAEITALTLWEDHLDARVTRYPLVIGDLTKGTGFPPGHLDAILTLSLLEHLTPLPDAVKEMYRILGPGGHLYALFGPVWSSPYGHHIYERPQDPLFDFSAWRMPAHIHLLCSPAEIARFYEESGYEASGGQVALHWFYEAAHINRLMYDDYTDILGARFQLVFQECMFTQLPLSHIELLRSRFPRYRDFTTYGAKYILQAFPR